MISLFSGSGSQEIEVLDHAMSIDDWSQFKKSAVRLMQARHQDKAASLLDSFPFEPRHGTNWFNDEHLILYLSAEIELYIECAAMAEDKVIRNEFKIIATTLNEISKFGYFRFIAAELADERGPEAVKSPNLRITSDIVETAIRDAEHLINKSGAVSGLDRIHTALHGYLRAICDKSGIGCPNDPSITALYKLIRENHPAMKVDPQHQDEIDRIFKSIAVIIDSLNPLRNRASLAHANPNLLGTAEAMLAVNAARTILHYLDTKVAE